MQYSPQFNPDIFNIHVSAVLKASFVRQLHGERGTVLENKQHLDVCSMYVIALFIPSLQDFHKVLLRMEFSPNEFRATQRATIQYCKHEVELLPAGHAVEFERKDYCPAVFRRIQELDDVDYTDYMQSTCGLEILREVSSDRKAGILHFVCKNDMFLIKTLKKSEVKVLLEMLPNYCRHIKKYGASLLTRFYGLHVVRSSRGIKVYFVVMANIFKTDLHLHGRYDLKGTSQGRSPNKLETQNEITLKDVDFGFCFYLDQFTRQRLLAQIKYDCEFLESEGIMDYSLIVGVHIRPSHQDDGVYSEVKSEIPNDSLHADEDLELTIADLCDLLHRPGFRFGVNMPARARHMPRNDTGSVSIKHRVETKESYHDVVLFFGIVDLLQSYNVVKRIEHVYKSLQYKTKSIPAVHPRVYSSRFQDFLATVFQANEEESQSHSERMEEV